MVVVNSFRDTNMPVWPLWWKIKTGEQNWWTDSKFCVTIWGFLLSMFHLCDLFFFLVELSCSECVIIYGNCPTGGGDLYLAKVFYRLQTHHYSQGDLGGSIQRNWISVFVLPMLIIYSRSSVVNWSTQGRQSYDIGSCWIILDSCFGKGK